MYYKDNQLYTESEIKALYPNTSFPQPFVAPTGFEVVFDTPQPEVTELQVAYQDGTEIDAKGNRVIKWSVRDMFEDTPDKTKAEQEEEYLLAKFKASVPKSITKVQAMKAMKATNIWTAFNTILAANQDALDEWTLAGELQRDNTFVAMLSPALGLTDKQVDELFILGATI